MKNPKLFLLLPVIALIMASLACATLSGEDTPTLDDAATAIVDAGEDAATQLAQITPESVTTPEGQEPTPAGDGETPANQQAGASTINLDDPKLYIQPAEINTYRANLVYTFSGQAADGTTVTGSIVGDMAYSIDPYEVSFRFESSDSSLPSESFEIVEAEGNIYMSSPEFGCLRFPVEEDQLDNPYDELLDTGGTLTGQAQRVEPDEVIDDVPVYVYAITSENLDKSDPASQEIDEITFGRIYLAKDGGYVVRIVMDGQGQNSVLSEDNTITGEVHYELNYFDYNQPVDIQPPAGCDPASGGGTGDGGVPIPEGVNDIVSFPGVTTFTSTESVEALATYYKTEMEAAGYSLDSDFTVPGVSTLIFSKGGKQVTVLITADEASGNTLVGITESQ